MNVLFVCSRNRRRSPTAEAIFAPCAGITVDSAGIDPGAEVMLDSDTVQWADVIMVMEPAQGRKLKQRFRPWLRQKRVVCLHIPDRYGYMDGALVALLEARVRPLLGLPR